MELEVNCYDVVRTKKVILKNRITGQKFEARAKSWRWKNDFFAYVTFVFRGQEFTVFAEVHPEINI